MTGFYATQYIFERAYGNYLGLVPTGPFHGPSDGKTAYPGYLCGESSKTRQDQGLRFWNWLVALKEYWVSLQED